MSRIFVLKKSTNKLKKWAVKEMIIPEPIEDNKDSKDDTQQTTNNNSDVVEVNNNTELEPKLEESKSEQPKKKYNPYPNKYRSKKPAKPKIKYGKLIYFGQAGYRDYITMSQEKKEGKIDDDVDKVKEIYINRHSKSEHWDDPNTAGFWSRWISWNKPTLDECIADIREQFDIEVRLQE